MKPATTTTSLASSLSLSKGVALLAAILLVACSDDSATEKIVEVAGDGIEVVSDVSQLPACSSKNDGEMVWVKNEVTPRMCSDGKWFAIAEGSVAATCSTEPLKDSSGVKIVCGGDSIGVVYNGLNGKDGAAGKDGKKGELGIQGEKGLKGDVGDKGPDGEDGADGEDGYGPAVSGTGCSMETVNEYSVRVICSNDSTILYVNGDAFDTAAHDDPVVLDSEKIAISLSQVSGVTQKGPFLSGSKVLVREMEDGRTLTQTGNSFNGKILNDKGEFRINGRMLVSQYVMFEVTGYYRNEVTGKSSNSELTLFAITDVNDRNTVNVNLLTHLEYERVIYLVTQKKMKVKAAKKQAQKEVFAVFNIDATNFANSEDLNIAGNTEADAALLAISIILQGNRSESELSELLQKIALDMEKDGTFDDSLTRNSLADWVAQLDYNDAYYAGTNFSCANYTSLDCVSWHVLGWGLSESLPDYAKYINQFWSKVYGLKTCQANNIGSLSRTLVKGNVYECVRLYSLDRVEHSDESSNEYYEYYGWMKTFGLDLDTFGWRGGATDGEVRYGNVTGKMYIYDSLAAEKGCEDWHEPDDTEKKFGACVQSRLGEYHYFDSRDEENGYVWRSHYKCVERSYDYSCSQKDLDYDWSGSILDIETSDWGPAEDGSLRWGDLLVRVAPDEMKYCYVYDSVGGKWQYAYSRDYCSLGIKGCTKGRVGEYAWGNDGSLYECVYRAGSAQLWQVTDRVFLNTREWNCLDSNDGEMRKGTVNDAYFVCEDSSWREATTQEEKDCVLNGVCRLHNCSSQKIGQFEDRDGVRYVCAPEYDVFGHAYNLNWRMANCAEERTDSLCLDDDGTIVWNCEKFGSFMIDYVCDKGWRPVKSSYDYTVENWLEKKTSYYIKENNPDAVYGKDLVDERDGNVYKTVFIGGRRWMAENLRFSDSANVGFDWHGDCDNVERVGCTYYWTTAMGLDSKWTTDSVSAMPNFNRRGICPAGWHIPDTTEWLDLNRNTSFNSRQMKGFSDWAEATDSTGFSILPDASNFWSSTESSLDEAFMIREGNELRGYGKSNPFTVFVRCIEDDKE